MARKNKNKKARRRSAKEELTNNDKLVIYLNDILAIENASIPRLQKRIKQVTIPEAKEQLKHHLEETKEQKSRLEELISKLGGKPTRESAKLPTPTPSKSLANSMKRSFRDADQQLIAAKEDAIIENAEIVMYDTVSQLAQIMGIGDAVPVLAQNLNEEKEMADWLRANIPAMLTQLYPPIEQSSSPITSEKSSEDDLLTERKSETTAA